MKSAPKKLIITFELPPPLMDRLSLAGLSVVSVTPDQGKAHLERELRGAWGLYSMLTLPVGEALLKRAPHLKLVANYAVGFNNIDLNACHALGITVLNTPDVLTRATAELTVSLLFSVARRTHEGELMVRSHQFKGWKPDMLLGLELKGRQATLVGKGRIGYETAKLFHALGLRTNFITRNSSSSEINKLLKQTQVLSLHLPHSESTHHWLSRARLSLLPPDAIVLNTGRGALIDEQALIQALRRKKLFGAGLDVYEFEPKVPRSLTLLKNTALLPHLGSATKEARFAMAELLVRGTLQLLNGKRPTNQVQKMSGHSR
jgi:glyoxylate reductase